MRTVKPFIVSVILNTNRREDTLECLTSLLANTYDHHKAIVLDNASTDGSVQAIREQFPTVEILSLTENLGYAGNNNVGIAAALEQGAEWVFVLNEDTILASDCLERLVEAAVADPEIGVLGPLVYHHDEPGIIQTAGGLLGDKWESRHLGQDEPDAGQYVHPHAVEWISGCAILVKAEVIRQVGMIDARYFYYWEELEWCVRAGKAGWKIILVPQSKLWHKGVQRDYQPKPSVTYYATRNRLLTLSKHRAPLRTRAYTWFQILRTMMSWTIRPKWREKRKHRDAMWIGVMDYLKRSWGQGKV